jgi:hypothetical protein
MKSESRTTDVYAKALKSMPKSFTSHYYTKKLRELGISNHEIANDYYYNFLVDECVHIKRLHWEKKPKVAQVESTQLTIPTEQGLSDEQMVERLKAKGYKVLKPTWSEL